jgi:hypothetical protein
MAWESIGKDINMIRRSMRFILGSAKTIETPNPRGENHDECQVVKGDYEWEKSCGEECYRLTVPKCRRGDGTTELDVGTLKENVKGCDWDMQFFTKGVFTCQC